MEVGQSLFPPCLWPPAPITYLLLSTELTPETGQPKAKHGMNHTHTAVKALACWARPRQHVESCTSESRADLVLIHPRLNVPSLEETVLCWGHVIPTSLMCNLLSYRGSKLFCALYERIPSNSAYRMCAGSICSILSPVHKHKVPFIPHTASEEYSDFWLFSMLQQDETFSRQAFASLFNTNCKHPVNALPRQWSLLRISPYKSTALDTASQYLRWKQCCP